MYVRKWCLLLVLNLTKWTFKENKVIKVKKNIKKISAKFLALRYENWGSGKKMVFLKKRVVHKIHAFLINNSGHIIKSCFFVKIVRFEYCFTVAYELDQIKTKDEDINKTILRPAKFYL